MVLALDEKPDVRGIGDVEESGVSLDRRLALRNDECWVCVQSQPHRELKAAENLDLQGYRSFVPSIQRQIRHARKVRLVLRPFFPRYIFIVLNTSQQAWRPILSTPGVSSVIMGGEKPKPVPEGVVESLVYATNTEGSLDFRNQLAVGQSVRLLTGPFAELLGKLERLDAHGRVTVLLEIMGGERRVTTERTTLQAVVS